MTFIARCENRPGLSVFVLVMALRVIGGLLFSAVIFNSPEGHMLILCDLPALAVAALSNWLFGIPCCLTDAFSADYLLSSAVGWIVIAAIAGAAIARYASHARLSLPSN